MKIAIIVMGVLLFAQGCINATSPSSERNNADAAATALKQYLKNVTADELRDVDVRLTYNKTSPEALREAFARISSLELVSKPAGTRKVSIDASVVENAGNIVRVNVTFRESPTGMTSAIYRVEKVKGGWKVTAITNEISS